MKKTSIIIIILLFNISCSADSCFIDPYKAKQSGEWGPYEINIVTTRMTKSLYAFLIKRNKPTLIKIYRIKNRTSEHIDTRLISEKIAFSLYKKGVSCVEDFNFQKEMGETNVPHKAIHTGTLKKPNLALYGEITDVVNYIDGYKIQHLVVVLKLMHIKTKKLVWKELVEINKKIKKDKIVF